MVRIVFYEKPGCINNRRQKQILRDAGADLDVRNLLTQDWSAADLQPYFAGMAVADWFNRSAPQIKAGLINLEDLSASEALAALIAEPLLIRRPLIAMGDTRCSGFQWPALAERLQLDAAGTAPLDIEACQRDQGGSSACKGREVE